MKVVYCDACKDISIKSRLEPDTCNTCGGPARRVPYSRPWQYYVSSVLLLAATAILVLAPIPNLWLRAGLVGAAVVVAFAFSSWSLRSMRARVLKNVRETAETEART